MTSAVTARRYSRETFYARYRAAWGSAVTDPYYLLEPWELSASERTDLLSAAAAIAAIYERVIPLVKATPPQFLEEIGVPGEWIPLIRRRAPLLAEATIARFDFVRTNHGYKLLELNADAPGLFVETFLINGLACQDLGRLNPNQEGESILKPALLGAIAAALGDLAATPSSRPYVVCAATANGSEDVAHAEYLARIIGLEDGLQVDSLAAESIEIDTDGLYDRMGNRIDILIRTIPLHCLPHRFARRPSATSGSANEDGGDMLRKLIRDGRLVVLNSPAALLWESKAMQALIWGLFEDGAFLTDGERRAVEAHMLPTFFDAPPGAEPYVVKPVLGFQGESVCIVSPGTGAVERLEGSTYDDQLRVYQKYAPLPEAEIMTEDGLRTLHLVASCFLIAGKPFGICMRADGRITSERARFLPVCGEP